MKVVICTVPMRNPNQVKPVLYRADGNKAIEYDKPVRSPINAVLAKTLKKGEDLKVIFIMTTGKNSNCEENKVNIIKELEDINAEIGAVLSYKTVEMEFSATKQTLNKLIKDLTEKIIEIHSEDAEFYVDITYGSKPELLSLFCALRFVEEFHGAVVDYFIYGKAEFNKEGDIENPVIFDITHEYYLLKLIGSIGTDDPEKALNILKDFLDS